MFKNLNSKPFPSLNSIYLIKVKLTVNVYLRMESLVDWCQNVVLSHNM